jgi:hypothetical protein
MGFLDQLRQQAGALQNQQHVDVAELDRRMRIVEAASKGAYAYLMEVAKHLNVLTPRLRERVLLGPKATIDGFTLSNFRFDARRKNLRDHEVFDHIVMQWDAKSGQAFQWRFDFIGEMQRLEEKLRAGGIEYERRETRAQDDNRLLEVNFQCVADLRAFVVIEPKHDEGRIDFELRNLEPFEHKTLSVAAHELTQALLDELAKRIVGEPNRFVGTA